VFVPVTVMVRAGWAGALLLAGVDGGVDVSVDVGVGGADEVVDGGAALPAPDGKSWDVEPLEGCAPAGVAVPLPLTADVHAASSTATATADRTHRAAAHRPAGCRPRHQLIRNLHGIALQRA
jgi:hypothetical protein